MCRCVVQVHRVCGIMCLCMYYYRGVVLCRNVHVHVCRNLCTYVYVCVVCDV